MPESLKRRDPTVSHWNSRRIREGVQEEMGQNNASKKGPYYTLCDTRTSGFEAGNDVPPLPAS